MKYETKIKVAHPMWLAVFIWITMPISGVGLDIYVPSLPDIHRYFGVQTHLVQLTVSLFILGNATTQVIFGTLSDAIGDKN